MTVTMDTVIVTGQINSPLISSFIRLRGNTMHLAESERVLTKHERYIELVELYNVKGQHDKCVCVCARCMHALVCYV